MKIAAWQIIPPSFRWRSLRVALSLFVRAALNFVGIAMLLPVLLLILDSGSLHSNRWLLQAWQWSGIESEQGFVVAVCVAVVAVVAAKSMVNLWLYGLERNFIYDVYRHLSRNLYIRYRNRGLQFIKNNNSALLTRNVNVVCLTFVTGVLMPVATIVSEAALFALLFGALALYDFTAALLVVAIFIPAIWLYAKVVRRRLNRCGEAENRAQRTKSRNVADTYRGYADLEISNAFPEMLRRFDGSMSEIVEMRKQHATTAALPQIFTELGLAAGMAAMVVVNLGVEGDRMRILFGVFAVMAIRVMPSVRNIMSAWSSIRYNRYTVDILREAGAGEEQPAVEECRATFDFRREIRVENLSFGYAGQEVLKNLTLRIGKGERVGIRGRSGSGKTTLFNLLLGFYAPDSGRILIDGEELTEANRRKWQNTIGYVSQSVFLVDGTFWENIALGVPPGEIDRALADRAIDMADLREFIDSLPDGAATKVGECGSRLSGGERQRIGIARALYKQAGILFFDEATSSLDNHTELNINRAIDALSRQNSDLTIVVIAHRESSLEGCDRIINIDNYEQGL